MSRGRGRGRGGFGGGSGASSLPPMGLTFADIQSMSRDPGELYPPMDPMPVATAPTEDERAICALQHGFIARLRASQYYLVESTKSDDLERYSDKYRPLHVAQPTLRRSDLHAPFFPSEIFEDYFNPKRRKSAKKASRKKMKLTDLTGEDAAGSDAEAVEDDEDKNVGSDQEGEVEDYDVDEEYDNDYAENYFDNGEGDDADDLGDGGGGGGDGGDYD